MKKFDLNATYNEEEAFTLLTELHAAYIELLGKELNHHTNTLSVQLKLPLWIGRITEISKDFSQDLTMEYWRTDKQNTKYTLVCKSLDLYEHWMPALEI